MSVIQGIFRFRGKEMNDGQNLLARRIRRATRKSLAESYGALICFSENEYLKPDLLTNRQIKKRLKNLGYL